MKAIERDEKIRQFFEDGMALLQAKGHDYAGDADCLGNLRRFGLYGIIVRLSDKFSRLEQFAKSGELKVRDESVKDTLMDIANYCYLGRLFLGDDLTDDRATLTLGGHE